MARSHTVALLAALLIAGLSTSTAQAPGPEDSAAAPASAPVAASGPAAAVGPAAAPIVAAGPATDIATTQTVGSGSSAVAATGVAPSSSELAGGEVCYVPHTHRTLAHHIAKLSLGAHAVRVQHPHSSSAPRVLVHVIFHAMSLPLVLA